MMQTVEQLIAKLASSDFKAIDEKRSNETTLVFYVSKYTCNNIKVMFINQYRAIASVLDAPEIARGGIVIKDKSYSYNVRVMDNGCARITINE